jgi:hypothetical protein
MLYGMPMKSRARVLIAAQADAWKRLQPMLDPLVDTVVVHTAKDAFRALERGGIDLIISTILFDGSRMIEFLQAVKGNASYGAIPFLCGRVLPTGISDRFIESTRAVCEQCGAIAFVDVAKFHDDEAQRVLTDVLKTCLPQK